MDDLSQLGKLMLYLAPNETVFSNVMEEVEKKFSKLEDTIYFGVIGGVDLSLSYMIASNADKGYFFDKNPSAIDYFHQRTELFKVTDNPEEYISELKIDNEKAHKKLSIYINLLEKRHPKEFNDMWYNNQEKFDKIKELIKKDKIKSFKADYYDDGDSFITHLMELEKVNNALVYLSNIAEWGCKGKEPEVFGGRNIILKDKLKDLDTSAIVESRPQGNNYISVKSWPSKGYAKQLIPINHSNR